MFVIKKIFGIITDPGTIVLLLLGYGFLRLLFTRSSRKRGLGGISLGLLCFYLFTTAPLPNYLLKNLESRYAPVTAPQKFPDIHYIVASPGVYASMTRSPPPASSMHSAPCGWSKGSGFSIFCRGGRR
jgi:hypothetical protein